MDEVFFEETNSMSLDIKFYLTSSMLNMFRTLIHPSSGACDCSILTSHWSCVLVSMCVGVSVWLGWGGICVAGFSLIHDQCVDTIEKSQDPDDGCNNVRNMLKPATRIPLQPRHTETPTHGQCGDTIEKSQATDDGYINVRNMFSIEEVK